MKYEKGQEVKIIGKGITTTGYVHRSGHSTWDSNNQFHFIKLSNNFEIQYKELRVWEDNEKVGTTDTGFSIHIID